MNFEVVVMFLHNLAVAVWIGGMVFLALMGKEINNLGQDFSIVNIKANKIFVKLAGISLAVLIITGIILTYYHGGANRIQSDWMLKIKHILIVLAVVNGIYLGVKVSPSIEKTAPKKGEKVSIEFITWQNRARLSVNLNLILGILIVLFATL